VKKLKPPTKQADKIAPEDAALFRAAVGPVKPLAEQNRLVPQSAPSKPVPRASVPLHAVPDTLSDTAPENTPEEYLSNGLSRMTLRKLRRGTWPIEDSLDLHGNHTDAARKLLQEFMHEAAQRNLRCVLVIHGKGLNSRGGEAVLRRLARYWLTQLPRVLGYCDAPPKHGGSGAALVLLKSNL
jgi:DNA-nicking Smr family endonuclease